MKVVGKVYKRQREKIYIVAGGYSQFVNYVNYKWHNFKETDEDHFPHYISVSSVNVLRGLSVREFKGFYIGSWANRKDIVDIQHMIAHLKTRKY